MQQLKRISRGAIVAIALSAGLAALPASAQRDHHGDHGNFMHHLAEVKAQLNLSREQQGKWDAVVAAGKNAREAARARRAGVRQVVTEEAANSPPRLDRIALATDQAHDSSTTDRRAVRDQWLKLYSTFNSDQIAVVKELLTKRVERMDSFRERMQRRFGNQ